MQLKVFKKKGTFAKFLRVFDCILRYLICDIINIK